jgi:hypothetical protein
MNKLEHELKVKLNSIKKCKKDGENFISNVIEDKFNVLR